MNVEEAVRSHRFREDLYYRLNVIQIEIPPLRERPDDIVRLAKRLLAFFGKNHHCASQQFTDEAIQLLGGYSWPGNVRELRNVVEGLHPLPWNQWAEYLPENPASEDSRRRVSFRQTRRYIRMY
jgi:transcriptional regulator with PAS, ATPase and Fis domain